MSLFEPDAPWQVAVHHIAVFKLSTQFISEASEADLAKVFADLRRRHIALAIESLIQNPSKRCGSHVEGYNSPESAKQTAERIKRLGGDLAYLAMDEPLWFGHEYKGPDACRDSIRNVARSVAKNIAVFRAVFPNVRVGDIEPLTSFSPDQASAEITAWSTAFEDATGHPLAFLHGDLNWSAPWEKTLPPITEALRRNRIPFGLIYNGDPDDGWSEAWIESAERHFEEYESDDRVSPDQVIFQSWMANPTRVLPETSPNALTYLISRYVRPRARLQVQRIGTSVVGVLTNSRGTPLASESLTVEAVRPNGPGYLSLMSIKGLVPKGAAIAVLALRVNVECNCAETNQLDIRPATYREIGEGVRRTEPNLASPAVRVRSDRSSAVSVGNANEKPALHIVAAPDDRILLNSTPFPVTANARFQLDIPVIISKAAGAYLALIFLDDNKSEIHRFGITLRADFAPIAMGRTKGNGHFSIPLRAGDIDGSTRLRVVFGGNSTARRAIYDIR
jgi:hypothetical protein